MTPTTESIARDFARLVIALPGWATDIEALCNAIHSQTRALGEEQGSVSAWAAVADRATAILRDAATCGPDAFMTRYADLLPDDLRQEMFSRAKDVLRDSGVEFEEFKDEAGETYLRVKDSEALRSMVSPEVLEEAEAMGAAPLGDLTRVQ